MLLRGANDYMLDEVDRALHDALCIVRRVLESQSVVPGGGAVEAALSVFLDNYASALGSREQLAINEYAEALLVIPKTLAVNAAKDATDLVAKLCALHSLAQKSDEKKYLSTVRSSAHCMLLCWRCTLCSCPAWLLRSVAGLVAVHLSECRCLSSSASGSIALSSPLQQAALPLCTCLSQCECSRATLCHHVCCPMLCTIGGHLGCSAMMHIVLCTITMH